MVEAKKGETDDDRRLATVLMLIKSGRGGLEGRVEDLELLRDIGVRFEPVEIVEGPQTGTDLQKLLAVSYETVMKALGDDENRKMWGAKKVVEGRNTRWSIPEDAVNSINQGLKLSVPLKRLYERLRDSGVRMDYHTFKLYFVEPERTGREGTALFEGKGGSLLVENFFSHHADYTDITSAAGIARYLLFAKKLLDEGIDSSAAAEATGVRVEAIRRIHAGTGAFVSVKGLATGRSRLRLTEDDLADLGMSKRPEERELIRRLLRRRIGEGDLKTFPVREEGAHPWRTASVHVIDESAAKNPAAYRVETEEEAGRRLAIEELMRLYGSISGIQENVSRIGLAKLGIEIASEDGTVHLRQKPKTAS